MDVFARCVVEAFQKGKRGSKTQIELENGDHIWYLAPLIAKLDLAYQQRMLEYIITQVMARGKRDEKKVEISRRYWDSWRSFSSYDEDEERNAQFSGFLFLGMTLEKRKSSIIIRKSRRTTNSKTEKWKKNLRKSVRIYTKEVTCSKTETLKNCS